MLESATILIVSFAALWLFDWMQIWESQTTLQRRANRAGRAIIRSVPAYRFARIGFFLIAPIAAVATYFRDNQAAVIPAMIAIAMLAAAYVLTLIIVINQRRL